MIEARAATCREEAVAAEGMALWLVPERHTGEDNLECGPLTLLPGEVLTVGKRDVDKKVYCLFKECYIMHVYMYICYSLNTYNMYTTGPKSCLICPCICVSVYFAPRTNQDAKLSKMLFRIQMVSEEEASITRIGRTPIHCIPKGETGTASDYIY